MRVTIPDDLADAIQALLPEKPLEELVVFQLKRFATINPKDRIIVIHKEDRQELEKVLKHGSISSASELLAAVVKRDKMTIGGIAIEYTGAQLREIQKRARKNKVTPAVMLADIAKETSKLMLDEV